MQPQSKAEGIVTILHTPAKYNCFFFFDKLKIKILLYKRVYHDVYVLTIVVLGMAPPEREPSSMQRYRSVSEEVSASNPSRAAIRHCDTYVQ